MRRIAFILAVAAAVMFMPVTSFADSYKVNGDELTITYDDPGWIVFTRDNIKDNRQLEKLGTDYETMLATMEKSEAYLVAVKGGKKERIEMQIRAAENGYINNINTLTDKEMSALAAGVDEKYADSLEGYSSKTVTLGDCRYIKMTGKYKKEDYDVVQYLTFINGKNYLIASQKVIPLTDDDKKQIEGIVAGAKFNEDPAKTENDVEAYVKSKQDAMNSGQKSRPVKIAITALVVVVIILVLKFKNRRRRVG